MTRPQNRKCDEGCTCSKHRAHPCAPGCTCSRHSTEWKRRKCPDGCTCGRHRDQRCPAGCTCSRHGPSPRRYTDDQRAEALDLRRAKNREYMLQRRIADPEGTRAQARATYGRHGRKHFLKYKFGLSLRQWDEMLIAQSGRCYLCADPLDAKIHIDHDRSCCSGNRSCGKCIRGLTCQLCNQGIGQFRDDPERMRRVANNLEAANRRLRGQQ